jgi:hypothetical protein
MRPQSKVARRVYWIASSIDERQREKAYLLSQLGFEVSFYTDLGSFVAQVSRMRPAIVVLASHGDHDFEFRILEQLMIMPEIRSAKMVLVCATANEALIRLASCFNFRDILPLDLPMKGDDSLGSDDPGANRDPWIQRFLYATSSRPKSYSTPTPKLTTSLSTTVGVPARISWISGTHIGIETRLRPKIGGKIQITGPLPAWYGQDYLDGKVESATEQKLRYHFSKGYVVSWAPPPGSEEKTRTLLGQFTRISRLPRPRIYVAIQDGSLRHAVLKTLDGGSYEVAAALQKQALAEEPHFFTPDFVIIESVLTTKENLRLIVGLMSALQTPITIVILGPKSLGEQLQVLYPQHRFMILEDVSPEAIKTNLGPTMAKLCATVPSSKTDHGETHDVLPSHNISRAEVQIPGEIVSLHPTFLQLHLEQEVAQYALIRIVHPVFQNTIGRNIYAKVITSQKVEGEAGRRPKTHLIDCYLADTNASDAASLAQVIWQEISKELTRYVPTIGTQDTLAGSRPLPQRNSSTIPAAEPKPPSGLSSDPPSVAKETPPSPDTRERESIESRLVSRPEGKAETKKSKDSKQNLARDLVTIIGIVGIGAFGLWLFFQWLSSHVEPSGGVYSDQLKKFAPHVKSE